MKIQTSNRLAHLQIELQETIQQNNCLCMQVQPKQAQIRSMENYLRFNNGDKRIVQQYKKACRELNTLYNRIARNNSKISRLQYNIQIEGMKANSLYAPSCRRRRSRLPRRYY